MTMSNAARERTVKGLLGTKLGMTQVWDADNRLIPVTVIQAGPNVVTQVRGDADGYAAVQLAYGDIDPRKVNKPMKGHFEKAGVTPRRHLVELRTADAADYSVGQEITATTFEAGQKVDATGTTKGKGFAGVMKRHGFAGVSSSHGAHRNHRKPGSIGACATPGRVFKGQRMAGRMGGVRQTTQNLIIHAVDADSGPAAGQGCRSRPPRQASSSSAPRRRGPDPSWRPPADLPARDLRRPGQRPADPPGRRRPARGCPSGHARDQDPRDGLRWWQASPTARRAPAAPVRARPVRRSSPAVASSTARSRVTTRSAPPRR
jgi:large subunit ribosomal protein L3